MQRGGVENRQRAILRAQQQADFGAAENHALRAVSGENVDLLLVIAFGFCGDFPKTQLFENNLIDARPRRFVRNKRLYAKTFAEPRAVEILLHGIARAEQRHLRQPRGFYGAARGVGDVQKRQRTARFYLVRHFMHRVGTQHNRLRARAFKPQRRLRQHLARLFPLAARLAGFYLVKIDAVQQQLRRVQSAETVANAFID